jgi:protein disulfide-isomerase
MTVRSLLPLLVTLAFALPASAAGDGWLTDFEAATKLAKETQRPILADFTGSDWCFYCKKLSKEVFATDVFKAWAKKTVVLLEVDFPNTKELPAKVTAQNEKLKLRYGIEAFPTTVFLSVDGKELGRSHYLPGGAKNWIEKAEALLAKAKPPAVESGWTESYDKAVARAKAEGKLVLADFTGSDWCGWCVRLTEEVFETAEFKEWAKKNVVLLELDYPRKKAQSPELKAQNQTLLRRHEVSGFPTILFLDPKTGKSLGNLGYVRGGPTAWIAAAEKVLKS